MTHPRCEARAEQGDGDCGRIARRVVRVRWRGGEWQRWGFCQLHLDVPERELEPAGFEVYRRA